MATEVFVDHERAERALGMEDTLASVRMEGLEPSHQAKEIFQRYVDGELTLDEMGRAIDEHIDREYGPVRLPSNERP